MRCIAYPRMGSTNENRRYNVTSSPIGWAHTKNGPDMPFNVYTVLLRLVPLWSYYNSSWNRVTVDSFILITGGCRIDWCYHICILWIYFKIKLTHGIGMRQRTHFQRLSATPHQHLTQLPKHFALIMVTCVKNVLLKIYWLKACSKLFQEAISDIQPHGSMLNTSSWRYVDWILKGALFQLMAVFVECLYHITIHIIQNGSNIRIIPPSQNEMSHCLNHYWFGQQNRMAANFLTTFSNAFFEWNYNNFD